MKEIALFCANGMSTSLLVSKMEAAAKENGLEYNIAAYPVSEISNYGAKADVILLGPQVKYQLKNVKEQFPDKPVEAINMQDYGLMNGANVIRSVRELLGD